MDLLVSLADEIRGFLRAKSRNADWADDLYQDLIVRLMASDTFKNADNPRAFIYAAANNLLTDHYRKNATRNKFLEAASADTENAVDAIDSERIVAARLRIEAVARAMAELPDQTREIFRLVRIKGMNQREASEELGITLRTVERHLAKALAHCHKRVQN